MTDETLRTMVEQLAERVDDLEDELADERDRRRDLEAERAQLAERVDDLEDERDRLQERVDDLERTAFAAVAHSRNLWEHFDFERDTIRRQIEGLHGRVSAVADGAADDSEGSIEDSEAALPIQQLAAMPEHVAKAHLDNEKLRNSYRARAVWMDWGDYSKKTPRGWVIKSGEMQRVLRALDDEGRTIDSTTAGRVMDQLEDLSKGIVEKQKRNGEWLVLLPSDWKDHVGAVAAAADTADSRGG